MKLTKDARKTLRFNSEIMEGLEARGWTAQKIMDWAIEQLADVKLSVKAKRGKHEIIKRAGAGAKARNK